MASGAWIERLVIGLVLQSSVSRKSSTRFDKVQSSISMRQRSTPQIARYPLMALPISPKPRLDPTFSIAAGALHHYSRQQSAPV
jgi:hypothetical protein